MAASLLLSPASGEVASGDTLAVKVVLTSETEAIGGVTTKISHSSNLHFVGSDVADSVFSTTVTEAKDEGGVVTLVRTRTDTGFTGKDGLVATLTFKAEAAGPATLAVVKDGSEAIAYTGFQNILADTGTGSYTVGAATTATTSSDSSPNTPSTSTYTYGIAAGSVVLLIVLAWVLIRLLREKR